MKAAGGPPEAEALVDWASVVEIVKVVALCLGVSAGLMGVFFCCAKTVENQAHCVEVCAPYKGTSIGNGKCECDTTVEIR